MVPKEGEAAGPGPEANPYQAYQRPPDDYVKAAMANRLHTIAMLILIWGIVGTIYGLYVMVAADSTADTAVRVLEDAGYWDDFEANGWDRDLFRTAALIEGVMFFLSGLAALVSAHFAYRAEHYSASLIFCVLSTLGACLGLFTLIIGIYMSFSLSRCRPAFKS